MAFDRNDSTFNGTMGWNARWNGKRVYVSNAHNSGVKFGLDGMVHRQSHVGNFGQYENVASEIYDPTPQQVGWICATQGSQNHYCRWSDSAIWEWYETVPDSLGLIAKTDGVGYLTAGSTTIDSVNPHWAIKAKLTSSEPFLYVGEWIEKVGNTSGWTKGKVTKTCLRWAHYRYSFNSNVDCQYESDLWSEGGDSGSPIWRSYDGVDPGPPDSPEGVELVGILWGGPVGQSTVTWFSVYDLVERDLGVMDPCIPGMVIYN